MASARLNVRCRRRSAALVLILIAMLWSPIVAGAAAQVPESRNLRVTVSAAGDATVSWRDTPGNQTDWVSVVPVGTVDNTYGSTWTYTSGQRSGSYTAMRLSPGEYEARLYLNWPSGGYTVVDRLRFRVGPVDTTTPPSPPTALPPAQTVIEITVESLERSGVTSRFTVNEQIRFCARSSRGGVLTIINAQRLGVKVLTSGALAPSEPFCEVGFVEAEDVSLIAVLVTGADTFVSAPYPLR
jgi:hypothetical protein